MRTNKAHLEHELKIQAAANLQFKYTMIAQPEAFARRANLFLKVLGIKSLNKVKNRTIVDDYYDFDDLRFFKSNCSLRVRRGETESKRSQITLKMESGRVLSSGLSRTEYESSQGAESVRRLLSNPTALFSAIGFDGDFDTSGRLLYLGSIKNQRLSLDIQTSIGRWRMCYDRFYYYKRSSGFSLDADFTRYFSEIEFEYLGPGEQPSKPDKQLEMLVGIYRDVFALGETTQSKFKRGVELAWGEQSKCDLVYVVGIDIAGYSTREPSVQLQLVQKLNKFVKDSINHARRSLGYMDSDGYVVYIPTGDGMFLVFDRPEDVKAILPMLVNLRKVIRNYNMIQRDADKKIYYRIALHSGPVFKYSDINENLNYAGNGINLASRVLDFTEANQILVSTSGKETLEGVGASPGQFMCLGPKIAKHNVRIEVWNYFDGKADLGITPAKDAPAKRKSRSGSKG
jgi:class 3 adenylate cyclase